MLSFANKLPEGEGMEPCETGMAGNDTAKVEPVNDCSPAVTSLDKPPC
jgi:hypothetical protein